MSDRPRRGGIWFFALDPVVGSEQRKVRPCVVVQRDSANETSPTTIVCPITSVKSKKPNTLNVLIQPPEGGVAKGSIVLVNQIRTVDRARMRGSMRGQVSEKTMALIDSGLRVILDLGDE